MAFGSEATREAMNALTLRALQLRCHGIVAWLARTWLVWPWLCRLCWIYIAGRLSFATHQTRDATVRQRLLFIVRWLVH